MWGFRPPQAPLKFCIRHSKPLESFLVERNFVLQQLTSLATFEQQSPQPHKRCKHSYNCKYYETTGPKWRNHHSSSSSSSSTSSLLLLLLSAPLPVPFLLFFSLSVSVEVVFLSFCSALKRSLPGPTGVVRCLNRNWIISPVWRTPVYCAAFFLLFAGMKNSAGKLCGYA